LFVFEEPFIWYEGPFVVEPERNIVYQPVAIDSQYAKLISTLVTFAVFSLRLDA